MLNAEDDVPLQSSEVMCNRFLNFFVDKVASLRPSTVASVDPAVHVPCLNLLIAFQPIVLPELEKLVLTAKPCGSPNDVENTKFHFIYMLMIASFIFLSVILIAPQLDSCLIALVMLSHGWLKTF